uniref:Odorant binding protein n=1 Tax=Eogystia hippophaecolus TaxID=1206364 RepID=A0A1B3P5I5_EOGHI|nr:odorant binding protein [Eogystia hippophaecolus]
MSIFFLDQVGHIDQGIFVENHNVMCYIACIYKLTQAVKNNKLNLDLLIKQIDILYPTDLKEEVKKSVYACIHVQDNYDDMCEAIFYTTKCFYEFDPKYFIFA